MSDSGSKSPGGGSSGGGGVKVLVEPRVCLHDSPTAIRVIGLQPHSLVTLTLTTQNDASKKFHTYAHYLSDGLGTVDVERSEAVGGAYKGVFPAGLFSTLKEFPYNYTRLQKDDPTTPWLMTLSVQEGHLTLEQSAGREGLASCLLERHLMAPGVRREAVVHERVRGTVFFPAGPGPYPALIDIFGGFGGLKEYRASMLASKGFACLAIAYFKFEDLPETLKTLDLEYFEEAVEYMLQQPGVIPDRCGVLCSSKGAIAGIPMGIHLPKVTAVVSVGGKLMDDTSLTFRGRELCKGLEINTSGAFHLDENNMISVDEGFYKKFYTHDHPRIPPCENAANDTHFLFVSGDMDGTHAQLDLEALTQRMKLNGREDHYQAVMYPGVGHIIEPPYNTYAAHSIYNIAGMKVIMKWGGGAKETCTAQEHNWHNMRKFLEIHVRERSAWYQQYVGRSHEEKK